MRQENRYRSHRLDIFEDTFGNIAKTDVEMAAQDVTTTSGPESVIHSTDRLLEYIHIKFIINCICVVYF